MQTIIRRNERSWAISMISDINILLRGLRLRMKRAGGEITIATNQTSMFPDTIFYGDDGQTQILQGWELKLPDTQITDTSFIADARRKAIALNLNSFFIWNFTAGVLYVQNETGSFEIEKQWNQTNHIQSRNDVQTYRNEWLPVIRQILIEINDFLTSGTIQGSNLGEILSDKIAARIIDRNKTIVSDELVRINAQNARIGAYLSVWWSNVQNDFAADETDMYSAYAKTLLLNWTNRLIFAHLIKSSYCDAREIETLNFDSSAIEANHVFEQITASCDFFGIFHTLEHNEYMPDDTWHDLMDLNIFLTDNGIQHIDQGALQLILEKTVTAAIREINGQFTTPALLADLLVRITAHDWTGNAIDPCCGTGSISRVLQKRKKQVLRSIETAISTTWAADKFSFPLQIANISMTDVEAINIPSRLFQMNLFSLHPGNEISVIDPASGERIILRIPMFTTVVSNLPFIHFEAISTEDQEFIAHLRDVVRRQTLVTLSNRNDYYSYLIFAAHSILISGGYLGVITSNSWLGTTAGRDFYKALGYYYNISQVHISGSGRWFRNAEVVTVILILQKREEIRPPSDDEITAFCIWQRNLSDLANDEAACDTLVNTSLLGQELDEHILKYNPYTNEEITSLFNMNISLSAFFHDVRWLQEIQDILTPMSTIFNIVRGERRGWDVMFYPSSEHGIEQQYIKRVLKSARTVDTLVAQADNDAFCCSASMIDLESWGHTGALSWIRRFEHGVNTTGKPLIEVLSRSNMYWYEMNDHNTADIITTMNPDRRLFFAKFDEPTFINQRLIGLKHKQGYDDIALYHALLNSILGMFYIESVGFGRGLGALDINKTTLSNALILNPDLLSTPQKQIIMEKFAPLLRRNILSTEDELEQTDRREFDFSVLTAYGIEQYYTSIKTSLMSMQAMRLKI